MKIWLHARSIAFLALLMGARSDVAQGQPAFLVKDIRPGTEDSFSSYRPDNAIVRTGASTGFFLGYEPSTGRELWKSDGTAGGTVMVKDISTASSSTPRELVNVAGTLFFVASDDENGRELWKSDGTAPGTQMVRDLCPGACYYGLSNLTAVGARLFFNATTPANGTELWTSDGTSGGTFMLKDIQSGPASSSPSHLTAVGTQIFFYATESSTGNELWKSDGTPSGTQLVLDINPGPQSSSPAIGPGLVDFLGTLLFSALDGNVGGELWRSDGTAAGTFRVKDIQPGSTGSTPSALVRVGDRVYFSAWTPAIGREIWKTDGTEAGTELVRDVAPGPDSSEPSGFTAAMGAVFFMADDGVNGSELWRSDGTATSTTLVRDLNPGPQGSGGSQLVNALGRLFLSADDGTGSELWTSDGTEAGTLVFETNPGSSSEPLGLAEVNGALLFAGFGGITGRELWRSDGTPGGTVLVKDLNTAPASSFPGQGFNTYSIEPYFDAVDLNGRLGFGATDGIHGRETWTTDGSEAGTGMVADLLRGGWGSDPSEITGIGGTAYFRATPFPAYGFWRTDGSAAGTAFVAQASSTTSTLRMVDLNGIPFFAGWGPPPGPGGLWKTDGTPAGTVLMLTYPWYPGLEGLVNAGGTLFFAAVNDQASTVDLWISDGTVAGTQMVTNLCSSACISYPPELTLTPVGRRVFFALESPGAGSELWTSDGTPAGTGMVKDIWPGPGDSLPGHLVSFRGRVFFSADDGIAGRELWTSDGTAAGTQMVKDVDPRPGWTSFPDLLTVAGDTLFFSASEEVNGPELWKSDGTASGTVVVKDIQPGSFGSFPKNLAGVGGSLLFSAQTIDHGREPWWTTGTEAATSLIQDIVPGPDSSNPLGFMASGDLVYFAASEPSIGTELWAVPLSEVTISSLSVDDVAISEGNSGAALAEFTVRLSAPSKQTVSVAYVTEDRTAAAGLDYIAAAGTLTFPPGTTALAVPVTILGDTIGEANETFVLTLSTAVSATITDTQATASVLDDDAGRFHTLGPCRVADTRLPVDGPALAANGTRTFVVAGRCGIPANAKAAALNLTVVGPSDFGDLRLYPAGLAAPGASTINFQAGRVRANNAVSPLGIDGRIAVQCDMPIGSSGTTHFVVDVSGYFQ